MPKAPAAEKKTDQQDRPGLKGKEGAVSRRLSLISLVIIFAVFAIFMVFTVALFYSGDTIHWKRELVEIERIHDAGRYEEAAERLLEFGRNRTGAQQTFNWNRQVGEYHAKAGDWATSARFYERALTLRPREPGINALAGEAFFKAGDPGKAREFLRREIEEVNVALGDHDRAYLYLGLADYEEGHLRGALEQFASISDREQWEDRMKPVYDEIEAGFLKPARELAATRSVEELSAP